MSFDNHNLRAFVALLGGLSFMCFSAILVKSSHAPGIVTTFYRMFLASLFLAGPFVYSRVKRKAQLSRKGLWLAVCAGLCFGLDMALWSTGVVASNATIPTVTGNMAPIWVGIGSVFLFREKHKFNFWLGTALAVSGIVCLLWNELFKGSGILYGAILGLLAGVFYGAFYLLAQPGRKLLDTLSFLFISTCSSAGVLLLIIIIAGHSLAGYDRETIFIFFAISLGVQVCGWFLVSYSQGFLPASVVAPTLLGQPLFTAVLATLLLDEKFTVWHIVGGIMIVAGIYVVHFSRNG